MIQTFIKEAFENVYWIEEGGYGANGVKGAKEILDFCNEPENIHT
jgi:hypothetical protein